MKTKKIVLILFAIFSLFIVFFYNYNADRFEHKKINGNERIANFRSAKKLAYKIYQKYSVCDILFKF